MLSGETFTNLALLCEYLWWRKLRIFADIFGRNFILFYRFLSIKIKNEELLYLKRINIFRGFYFAVARKFSLFHMVRFLSLL